MKNRRKPFSTVALYFLSVNWAFGQILDRTYLEEGPINIGTTLSFQSEILAEERRILVSLPHDYASSSSRYPVVYILDPLLFYQFGYASSVSKTLSFIELIPKLIVVGVHSEDREADLLTAFSGRGGNANDFIEFFRSELQPFIDEQFRTEPYRILIGHSAGGFFALHAFLRAPDTFNAYIALDPAVWWDDGKLIGELKEVLDTGRPFANTLFTANSHVEDDYYESFIRVVSEGTPEGLDFSHTSFPQETHASLVVPGIHDGLRSVYEDWPPPVSVDNLGSLLAHYQRLSERFGYSVEVPFTHAVDVGFRARDPEAMLAIAEYSLEEISQNEIAYYLLGHALRGLGRLPEALIAFERAIELGPDSHMFGVFNRFRDEVIEEMRREQ